jgi:hypothetical protein
MRCEMTVGSPILHTECAAAQSSGALEDTNVAISNVVLEDGVVIFQKDLVNLYGCRIGAGTKIEKMTDKMQRIRNDVSSWHPESVNSETRDANHQSTSVSQIEEGTYSALADFYY